MARILAIDPGPELSAWVVWDGYQILSMGKKENLFLLSDLIPEADADALVIEEVASYGMAVGRSVFTTVFWSGRFYESWDVNRAGNIYMIPRMKVKMHLCHNSRANDSNIRQALIDRYEPDLLPRQRPKGILKGVSKDVWAALGLAVTFLGQDF